MSTCPKCNAIVDALCHFNKCKHAICHTCMSDHIEDTLITKRRSFLSIGCCEKVIAQTMMGRMQMNCDGFLTYDEFQTYANEKTKKHHIQLLKTIPNDNPTSLKDFGYGFNEKGQLRNLETGEPFHYISETHYEALGDFIVQEIQNILKTECDLDEIFLPTDNTPKVNIFASKDLYTCEKLMMIVQGSGAVRAGQWARALCLNDSLHTGAIIDYVLQARKEGYGVIVFNPNMNSAPIKPDPYRRSREGFMNPKKLGPYSKREVEDIPEHDSPPQHVISVWDNVISKCKAKDIVSVSHSAGGHGTLMLLRYREDDVLKRLRGIAFTDSVHSVQRKDSKGVQQFVMDHCVNWVTSKQPLDTKLGVREGSGCLCVSAGHDTHENTSSSAQSSVFPFLASKIPK